MQSGTVSMETAEQLYDVLEAQVRVVVSDQKEGATSGSWT